MCRSSASVLSTVEVGHFLTTSLAGDALSCRNARTIELFVQFPRVNRKLNKNLSTVPVACFLPQYPLVALHNVICAWPILASTYEFRVSFSKFTVSSLDGLVGIGSCYARFRAFPKPTLITTFEPVPCTFFWRIRLAFLSEQNQPKPISHRTFLLATWWGHEARIA